MDDPGAMGMVERVADLDRDRERFVDWQCRRALESIGQGFAFEVFEDEVVTVAVTTDIVDGADVRIVERRNRARFVFEALSRLGIVGQRPNQHFDRDRPVEPRVARAVDLPHPARAKRRQNLVRS
jgi:hypothetical protein